MRRAARTEPNLERLFADDRVALAAAGFALERDELGFDAASGSQVQDVRSSSGRLCT
jgi:hypothetical protein